MLQRGLQPDVVTNTALIRIFLSSKQLSLAMDAFNRARLSCQLDGLLFRTMLELLSKQGRHQEALDILKLFKESGLPSDSQLDFLVIHSLCKGNRIDDALVLFRSMGAVIPTVSTYNTLIRHLGLQGRMEEVKTIQEEMKAAGVQPNDLTFAAMMEVFCSSKRTEDAVTLFGEVKGVVKLHSAVLHNILIEHLFDDGQVDRARQLFDSMDEESSPNIKTFEIMITAYAKLQAFDQVDQLVSQMAFLSLQPTYSIKQILRQRGQRTGK